MEQKEDYTMLARLEEDIKRIKSILVLTEALNKISDIDSLLENILLEARQITGAEAGSIYLTEGNELEFRYVQNDILAVSDPTHTRHLYQNIRIPIDEYSIAGYTAKTRNPVRINDVYHMQEDVPYQFNKSFDRKSDYRTQSMLTVPLITASGELLGVMQLINARDSTGKYVEPFNESDVSYVGFLANNVSVAIEKAKMTREIILRMIHMAELRDPTESAPHVNRVGAYSIEIYQKWARDNGISPNEVLRTKDGLRIAAMLHDVGKVAVTDTILKKPSRLEPGEFDIIKTHCEEGARLFDTSLSGLDQASKEIALSHHEKWDGSGYPRGLEGEQIPLFGRIVAIADVFDALVSTRVYKGPWPEKDAFSYIEQASGSHFWPEAVDSFLSIKEVISAVRKKFPDNGN
ncbi:MAG: GAF domain-containing protein [Spirochaetales bacterium]|nr:GAF domain-containing protein [Spirochaetales bacterium]MCF7938645.1 GAF domain-containing protein [Spirochaetales bacterium]